MGINRAASRVIGQAHHRTRRAVQRGVPFGLYCYTITVIWYALHGHHPQDAAGHRAQAPWYLTKTHPAFSDMTAKLRRCGRVRARRRVRDHLPVVRLLSHPRR